MAYAVVRLSNAHDFRRPKSLLVVINRLPRAPDHQIGCDGVIAVWTEFILFVTMHSFTKHLTCPCLHPRNTTDGAPGAHALASIRFGQSGRQAPKPGQTVLNSWCLDQRIDFHRLPAALPEEIRAFTGGKLKRRPRLLDSRKILLEHLKKTRGYQLDDPISEVRLRAKVVSQRQDFLPVQVDQQSFGDDQDFYGVDPQLAKQFSTRVDASQVQANSIQRATRCFFAQDFLLVVD